MELEVQYVSVLDGLPSVQQLEQWAKAALLDRKSRQELNVRIVDADESQQLNKEYRGKDKPTNVLSFPFEAPPGVNANILGDLVICAPVVRHEALEQGKTESSHWAHMVVHGMLHLQGYDHENDADAEEMESREVSIMKQLDFDDPYGE